MNVASWKQFMLSSGGRVTRKHYNLFLLVQTVIYLLAVAVDYERVGNIIFNDNTQAYLSNTVQLIFLWPFIMFSIKRLHDMNFRGGWLVAGFFGPISVIILTFAMTVHYLQGTPDPSIFPVLKFSTLTIIYLCMLIVIVFLLIMSLRKGTTGSNRFGDDPLQLSNENILVSEGV